MAQNSAHDGHRQRLKERFKKEGLENFEFHNALELLLFYSIPYKDTNETAHLLLDNFGTLKNLLDAPIEEIVKIQGVGENSASLLKLVKEFTKKSVEEYNKKITILGDVKSAKSYCERLLYGCTVEEIRLICLDNKRGIIHSEKICEGTVNHCLVDMRKIVENALKHNSAMVMLAHNHPRGDCRPSVDDIEFTNKIKALFNSINIELVDHIIVGEDSVHSMAAMSELSMLF